MRSVAAQRAMPTLAGALVGTVAAFSVAYAWPTSDRDTCLEDQAMVNGQCVNVDDPARRGFQVIGHD